MSDQTLEAAAIRVEAIAEETPFQVEASEPHTGVSSKCYLGVTHPYLSPPQRL